MQLVFLEIIKNTTNHVQITCCNSFRIGLLHPCGKTTFLFLSIYFEYLYFGHFALVKFVHISQSYLEYDGWLSIDLFHALDISQPDKFTLRGNISISSLSSVSYTLIQEPLSGYERGLLKVSFKLCVCADKLSIDHKDSPRKYPNIYTIRN